MLPIHKGAPAPGLSRGKACPLPRVTGPKADKRDKASGQGQLRGETAFRYVDKYSEPVAWEVTGVLEMAELKEHVAPLIVSADELAKRFDYLMITIEKPWFCEGTIRWDGADRGGANDISPAAALGGGIDDRRFFCRGCRPLWRTGGESEPARLPL